MSLLIRIIFLCTFMTSVLAAPANITIFWNDLDRLTYAGPDTDGRTFGDSQNAGKGCGPGYQATSTRGSSVSFNFTGTALQYTFLADHSGSNAAIMLDGKLADTVPTFQKDATAYSTCSTVTKSIAVGNGMHLVEIVNTPLSAILTVMYFQNIAYTPEDTVSTVVITSTPSSTSTEAPSSSTSADTPEDTVSTVVITSTPSSTSTEAPSSSTSADTPEDTVSTVVITSTPSSTSTEAPSSSTSADTPEDTVSTVVITSTPSSTSTEAPSSSTSADTPEATVSTVVITSTPSSTSTEAPSSSTSADTPVAESTSSHSGAVIAAVIAGVIVLLLLITAILGVARRRRQNQFLHLLDGEDGATDKESKYDNSPSHYRQFHQGDSASTIPSITQSNPMSPPQALLTNGLASRSLSARYDDRPRAEAERAMGMGPIRRATNTSAATGAIDPTFIREMMQHNVPGPEIAALIRTMAARETTTGEPSQTDVGVSIPPDGTAPPAYDFSQKH
ncbi:hypothetical protein FRB95_013345 [Tulasnella sp. JGI-2019a]|nr:hypothetical protein FRB95_013345 [Tulasnella sp. JGI-2019a]